MQEAPFVNGELGGLSGPTPRKQGAPFCDVQRRRKPSVFKVSG